LVESQYVDARVKGWYDCGKIKGKASFKSVTRCDGAVLSTLSILQCWHMYISQIH